MMNRVAARWVRRVATAVPASDGELYVISPENLFRMIQSIEDWGRFAFDCGSIDDYDAFRLAVRKHQGAVFYVPEGLGAYQVDIPQANAAEGPLISR